MWRQSDDVAPPSGRMSNSSRGRLVGAPDLFRTWTLIGRPSQETRECSLRCQGRLRLPIGSGVGRPGLLGPRILPRHQGPSRLELLPLEATQESALAARSLPATMVAARGLRQTRSEPGRAYDSCSTIRGLSCWGEAWVGRMANRRWRGPHFRRRRHQCPERALRGVLAAGDGRESERKLAATGSSSKWPECGANQGRRTGHEAVSTGIPQNAYLGACSADREPEGRLAFSGQVSHPMGYPLRPEGTRHGLDAGGLLSQVRYGSTPRSPPDSRCSGFCRHLLVSCDWNLNTRNGPGRPVRIEAPPRGAFRNLVVSARAGSAAGGSLQVAADPAV